MFKSAFAIFSVLLLLTGNLCAQGEQPEKSCNMIVTAKIISFRLKAGESISGDEVSTFFGPSVTKLRVISPEKYKGKKIILIHSTTPSSGSIFRMRGSVITFNICENQLDQRSVPVDEILLRESENKIQESPTH